MNTSLANGCGRRAEGAGRRGGSAGFRTTAAEIPRARSCLSVWWRAVEPDPRLSTLRLYVSALQLWYKRSGFPGRGQEWVLERASPETSEGTRLAPGGGGWGKRETEENFIWGLRLQDDLSPPGWVAAPKGSLSPPAAFTFSAIYCACSLVALNLLPTAGVLGPKPTFTQIP